MNDRATRLSGAAAVAEVLVLSFLREFGRSGQDKEALRARRQATVRARRLRRRR